MTREWIPCRLCGGTADHRHHVYGGPNRRLSEQYGMVEWLCRSCHEGVHTGSPGGLILKMAHQTIFERTHTREEFRRLFGKSWIT